MYKTTSRIQLDDIFSSPCRKTCSGRQTFLRLYRDSVQASQSQLNRLLSALSLYWSTNLRTVSPHSITLLGRPEPQSKLNLQQSQQSFNSNWPTILLSSYPRKILNPWSLTCAFRRLGAMLSPALRAKRGRRIWRLRR